MIQDILADYYLVLKSLHIIAVISWMAGMLYLPRLFVYHCGVPKGSDQSNLFKVMERRLLKVIINPAMILTFIFGGLLLFVPGVLERPFGWIHAKLVLVFCLAGVHGVLAKHVRIFSVDSNEKTARYFRLLNEVPTLIMIFVVFLVVLKPF